MRTIDEILKVYDLELDRVIKFINNKKPKKILLQFPEGLKKYGQDILDYIESKTSAECLIWMDSCFGGCDTPVGLENLGIDLVIHFGHSKWKY